MPESPWWWSSGLKATVIDHVERRRERYMTQQRHTTIVAEPGKQEIVITREFDAPRELVFKAFTDPQLIPQWWGPRYLSTEVDKMDVRPGGAWRWINRDAEGNA